MSEGGRETGNSGPFRDQPPAWAAVVAVAGQQHTVIRLDQLRDLGVVDNGGAQTLRRRPPVPALRTRVLDRPAEPPDDRPAEPPDYSSRPADTSPTLPSAAGLERHGAGLNDQSESSGLPSSPAGGNRFTPGAAVVVSTPS
jgi:hypothetical protein